MGSAKGDIFVSNRSEQYSLLLIGNWEVIQPTPEQHNVAIAQGLAVGAIATKVESNHADAAIMGLSCGIGDGLVKLAFWVGNTLGDAMKP